MNKPMMKRRLRLKGYIIFGVSMLLLAITSLVTLYATNVLYARQQLVKNDYSNAQAFAAAAAGLDYGIAFLQTNSQQIVANTSNGYLQPYTSTQTTNVVQQDGSRFSINYTNPTQDNFTLIQVSAVGSSNDGLVTRTITQLVKLPSGLLTLQPNPLNVLQAVNLNGNAQVTNNQGAISVRSGGSTSLAGSSTTIIKNASGGTSIGSKANNLGADIQQNYGPYQSMGGNGDKFFQSYFGKTKTQVKNMANLTITNTRGANISSSLNGVEGKIIWVNQSGGEATINGNTTIGSPTNPVILIISTNGNIQINGNVTIYGLLYVAAANWSNNNSGSVNIIGSVAVEGNFNINGNVNINYNNTVYNKFGSGNLAKVPGSWRDYL